MTVQRARVAENRVRNNLSNGPLRVQSKDHRLSILQREAYVSWQGYVGIL